jgi:hypothetical protein
MVNNFIKSSDESQSLVLPDRLLINQCFYHFKNLYHNLEKGKGGAKGSSIPMAIEASPSKQSAKGSESGGGGGSKANS